MPSGHTRYLGLLGLLPDMSPITTAERWWILANKDNLCAFQQQSSLHTDQTGQTSNPSQFTSLAQWQRADYHCQSTADSTLWRLRRFCSYVDPHRHCAYWTLPTCHYNVKQQLMSSWQVSKNYFCLSKMLLFCNHLQVYTQLNIHMGFSDTQTHFWKHMHQLYLWWEIGQK